MAQTGQAQNGAQAAAQPAGINREEHDGQMVLPKMTVENGHLVVRLPLVQAMKGRRESESGKNLLLTYDKRNIESEEAGTVTVQVTAYVRNPDWTKAYGEAMKRIQQAEDAKAIAAAEEKARMRFAGHLGSTRTNGGVTVKRT